MRSNVQNAHNLDRDLGFRYFTKPEDGKVYETKPTGLYGADGNPIYEDKCVSNSSIEAKGYLTLQEYKMVDKVVTDERNRPNRITTWLRSLKNNVVSFDGMENKAYFYNIVTGKTSSRSTMDMEDDAPGSSISMEEDGVPLPIEFSDWLYNIRRDSTASKSAGYDVSVEKAGFAAEGVANGLDLRMVNGWGGLTYRGMTVYGLRDNPTTSTVKQTGATSSGGWLETTTTTTDIYNDIMAMVKVQNANGVGGPYVLMVPESFRFRLAEPYFVNTTTGAPQSLWMKLLEKPDANIPNVMNIQEIKLIPELDLLNGGGAPTMGEAYLLSLDPKWFRVLNYLPMQSFTIGLKGNISTKHRVVEGVCPLFKRNAAGKYGIVKLTAPVTAT